MYLKMQSKETGLFTSHKVALTHPLLYNVLLKVNQMKRDFPYEQFMEICKRIVEIRG